MVASDKGFAVGSGLTPLYHNGPLEQAVLQLLRRAHCQFACLSTVEYLSLRSICCYSFPSSPLVILLTKYSEQAVTFQ